MRFSVVIPAYNEEDWIRTALDGLKNQIFDDFEVIVVVGGDDKTYSISKEYTKRVYKEPKGTRGPASARNFGARKAKGEIVTFLDADTLPNPNWLAAYDTCFSKGVVGSGGPVHANSTDPYLRFMFWMNQDLLYRISSSLGFHQFSGNNCAYRKKEFLKIGGFNEKTSMLEDVELANRMKKMGKEVFCPGAWVKTSTRRFEEEGFWRTFYKNMIGYWELWKQGKAEVSYFRVWKKRKKK